MHPKPKHIDGYVYKISSNNKFFKDNLDDFTIPYAVKCTCGNEVFKVFLNTSPTVIAKCSECSKDIIVYDLKHYPAATPARKEEELIEYKSEAGDDNFNICVIYEYSDEFSFDDEEFDPNDITWCHVHLYGTKSKKSFYIVNDETA